MRIVALLTTRLIEARFQVTRTVDVFVLSNVRFTDRAVNGLVRCRTPAGITSISPGVGLKLAVYSSTSSVPSTQITLHPNQDGSARRKAHPSR
jgi:hypothetical protein